MLSNHHAAVRASVIAAASLVTAATALASTVDLTTAGASGSANGAVFTQVDVAPAGTGVIDSFLRIQGAANGGAEAGYNTDARPVQFDEKTDANFTRSLLLSAVPTVVKDGVAYRQFLLDNNEPAAGSKSMLSLDSLQVFLSPIGNPTGVTLANPVAALGALVYSLDTLADDNTVMMDASLAQGSGHYDVLIEIPESNFAVSSNPYVVFLATFGITAEAEGGFEEFAVPTVTNPGGIPGGGPVPIPLPAALTSGLTTLASLALLAGVGRVRRSLVA